MNYRAVFTQMMEFKEKRQQKIVIKSSTVEEGDAFTVDEGTEYVKTGHRP